MVCLHRHCNCVAAVPSLNILAIHHNSYFPLHFYNHVCSLYTASSDLPRPDRVAHPSRVIHITRSTIPRRKPTASPLTINSSYSEHLSIIPCPPGVDRVGCTAGARRIHLFPPTHRCNAHRRNSTPWYNPRVTMVVAYSAKYRRHVWGIVFSISREGNQTSCGRWALNMEKFWNVGECCREYSSVCTPLTLWCTDLGPALLGRPDRGGRLWWASHLVGDRTTPQRISRVFLGRRVWETLQRASRTGGEGSEDSTPCEHPGRAQRCWSALPATADSNAARILLHRSSGAPVTNS
ncbi:hypothetical protein EDC01DRAFT_132458 [Geopyxis carbonaria]|nr:hypothetical protein EDC01DRAFT_132458 [Geopyxis carbonaria]